MQTLPLLLMSFTETVGGNGEHRRGIDAQARARCERRQPGVAAIEFNVRMFVSCGRASGTADTADADPSAFGTHLKISHMKYRQRNVGQVSQSRIIKSYYRIGWRRLTAILGKARGHVQWRVASTVRVSIEVHRIRKMCAAFDTVIADDVCAIQRIGRRHAGRLDSVGAGYGVGPAITLR